MEQARTMMRSWMTSSVRRDEIWESMTDELKMFYNLNIDGSSDQLDCIANSFATSIVDAI